MRICLVIGAGASLANALEFHPERHKDTWPPLDTTFFETVARRKDLRIGPHLQAYFRNVLGREPTIENLREYRMEEVFGDAFYDLLEDNSNTGAVNAYIELVELYLQAIRGTTNWLADKSRTGAPIGKLIAAAAEVADEISIVTFNHDLVIENEIARRARLANCWCVDEGYGHASQILGRLNPDYRVPMFRGHGPDCTHRITILKVHGSLSWVHRLNTVQPTAGILAGKPPKNLFLLPARKVFGREAFKDPRLGKGRKDWKLWPLVIPPVYAKQNFMEGILELVRADAKRAVKVADRIVFFGYSLPKLDIESVKLFERSIQANSNLRDIDVINPQPDAATRFAQIAPERRLHWFPDMDEFLDASPFQKRLTERQ